MSTINAALDSYDLLSEELISRGYRAEKFNVGKRFTRFHSPAGGSWLTRNGLLIYPFVSMAARYISRDKRLSESFVRQYGVSVPPAVVYDTNRTEISEFLELHAPVVVKPMNGQGSHGLTLNVRDEASLEAALLHAKTYSDFVLVQKQFEGEEVRLTVVDGIVVSAILRQTPRVVGDGISTIAELIKKENVARSELSYAYITYPQLTGEIIPAMLLTEARVPVAGEIVELTKSTLVRTGASLYNLMDTIHQSYKALAVKLTQNLNPDFLIVDLMIRDYRQPLSSDNYIFLEFTTSPALKMYYGMRAGRHYDIVNTLAGLIDEYCASNSGQMLASLSE